MPRIRPLLLLGSSSLIHIATGHVAMTARCPATRLRRRRANDEAAEGCRSSHGRGPCCNASRHRVLRPDQSRAPSALRAARHRSTAAGPPPRQIAEPHGVALPPAPPPAGTLCPPPPVPPPQRVPRGITSRTSLAASPPGPPWRHHLQDLPGASSGPQAVVSSAPGSARPPPAHQRLFLQQHHYMDYCSVHTPVVTPCGVQKIEFCPRPLEQHSPVHDISPRSCTAPAAAPPPPAVVSHAQPLHYAADRLAGKCSADVNV